MAQRCKGITISRSILLTLMLGVMNASLLGQVSPQSTGNDSLPASDAGRPASTFGIQENYVLPDSGYVPAWARAQQDSTIDRTFPERIQYRWEQYQAVYGPKLYEVEDQKMRFYIRFPKRDSIDFPFPRGILPQPDAPPFDPTVAWQRSALIPGWGQAYNKSYWKIPIFLIGYAGAGYWLYYNHQEYQRYGDAFYCAAVLQPDGVACTIPADIAAVGDNQGIRNQRNTFRQNRDNAILYLLGWHGIQVIEAFVDAHLKNFDVSPDLGMMEWDLSPTPISTFGMATPGIGLSLKF